MYKETMSQMARRIAKQSFEMVKNGSPLALLRLLLAAAMLSISGEHVLEVVVHPYPVFAGSGADSAIFRESLQGIDPLGPLVFFAKIWHSCIHLAHDLSAARGKWRRMWRYVLLAAWTLRRWRFLQLRSAGVANLYRRHAIIRESFR